jgi:hypothetical protein
MVEILDTPFPEYFYKKQGWFENLVNHYGKDKEKLPEDVLHSPMQLLTDSLYDVVEIYGNFPEIVYNALGQVIDPLFSPEEYKQEIYQILYDAGIAENRPMLVRYAQGLLVLRNFFEQNEEFYKKHFSEEIGQVGYKEFTCTLRYITKIHINQFRKIISSRKE